MPRPVPLFAAALFSSLALAPSAMAAAPQAGPSPVQIQAEPYSAYLIGREAMGSGDNHQGAAWLEALAAAYPDQPMLRRNGFTAALMAGDIPTAATLAPRVQTAEDTAGLESLGRVVRAAEAMSKGRGAEAVKILDLPAIGLPYRTAGYLLKPWADAGAGDWTAALAEPQAGGDRLAELFVQLGHARLLELKGRTPEAEAAYKTLATGNLGASLFKLPYGEFLERRGRTGEALAVYDEALKSDPADGGLIEARARAARHGRPPAAPSVANGAAQALTYASAAMNAAHQTELGLIYLRLALHLDPNLDEAWLMIGEDLAQSHEPVAAREAWARVPQGSRFWPDARSRLAYSLSQSGDNDGAVKLARATVAVLPHDLQSELALADLLRNADQDQAALAVLDQMLKDGADKDWRVRYMRAMAFDKLGRWSEAEPELKQALVLAPDEPDIENYLGYSWIDHGDHVKDGLALVQKAVAARPNSGAMQDSLGWAHYRMGDFRSAVTDLEKAVELEPADPAINDHLGDAYWMAGRKTEASYQWNRVLSLDPDAKLKAQAERKVREGLAARVAER